MHILFIDSDMPRTKCSKPPWHNRVRQLFNDCACVGLPSSLLKLFRFSRDCSSRELYLVSSFL